MMHRREFLQSPFLALLFFLRARHGIGEVRFCRFSHPRWAGLVPAGCVAELDSSADGITLLGIRATLTMNREGCRLFPASEVSSRP